MKRVILIVMDSLGIGELPDASKYGDQGSDTLGHIYSKMIEQKGSFNIKNLQSLGFFNIEGAAGGKARVTNPLGSFGRLMEHSTGKDTITGHWEIAGLYTQIPFKTYPEGFPDSFIKEFEAAIGTKVLGNYPASGTEIIEILGPEHEETGYPIVYTSADSVFQIAANIDVIPLSRLYEICEIARKMLVGDIACGRVIARPYEKQDGHRIRTSDRHDYAVSPPNKTMLDNIKDAGQSVYAVGKINDIFNGCGVTQTVHTTDNMDGIDQTLIAMEKTCDGLIFTNLVDFDSKFGHRRDPIGYGNAIEQFDRRLPEILDAMTNDDVLVICADHGNDPIHSGWDHTREYIPALIKGDNVKCGVDFGSRQTFADIGATICEYLGVEETNTGISFWNIIGER